MLNSAALVYVVWITALHHRLAGSQGRGSRLVQAPPRTPRTVRAG